LRSLLSRVSRIDVLVIDDWAMAPLSEPERRDFWEICEDRYQVRSTILTSQLPVARWNEQIGDPTLADGILDRLVHNAHRIEMRGDSMRKNRGKADTYSAQPRRLPPIKLPVRHPSGVRCLAARHGTSRRQ
jgi:DNA replication protein DnaC